MSTLLIVASQFIVLTDTCAHLRLLSDISKTRLYESLELTDNQNNRAYVIRQYFGHDAVGFLPATSIKALMHYAESYEGLHAEIVKGIAACILTGTPIPNGENSGKDGGSKVPLVKPPKTPKGSGAFNQLLSTGVNAS